MTIDITPEAVERLARLDENGDTTDDQLWRFWANKARALSAALTASQAETAALKSAVFKDSDPENLYVVMDEACNGTDTDEMLDFYAAAASGAIRASIATPTDSKAALDRMIAEARADGMREAAILCGFDEKSKTAILAAIPKGKDHE